MAGAEGEIAESVSMAALGYEETEAFEGSVDDPTETTGQGAGAMTEAAQAMQQASGFYSGLNAAANVLERAGMPPQAARDAALGLDDSRNRDVAAGGLITETSMARTAATFGTPIGMAATLGEMLGRAAFASGFDVQDVGEVDAGDTPASVGGDAAPPSPAVLAAGSSQTAGSTTMAQAPAATPAPSATSAPAATQTGPTSAAAATATPLTAVGARRTQARRRGRSSTIATSTLGVPGQAGVARKTLLGA